MKLTKYLCHVLTIKNMCQMMEFEHSNIFPLDVFKSIFYFCLLVSVLCLLWLWNFWIEKFKIALVTSFILLLYLAWFLSRLINKVWKHISNCNTFFVFQNNNSSIFTINISNIKNWTPLLHFFINCIFARSAPKILSLKENTFCYTEGIKGNERVKWKS